MCKMCAARDQTTSIWGDYRPMNSRQSRSRDVLIARNPVGGCLCGAISTLMRGVGRVGARSRQPRRPPDYESGRQEFESLRSRPTRFELVTRADTSISGIRVARELEQLIATRGKPKPVTRRGL